jgi:hypothetical protein
MVDCLLWRCSALLSCNLMLLTYAVVGQLIYWHLALGMCAILPGACCGRATLFAIVDSDR